MRVLVDTPVWSFALRRRRGEVSDAERAHVALWAHLVRLKSVILIGPVRQEVLSGVRERASFDRLLVELRAFHDERLDPADYEEAARCSNVCRSARIAHSSVDMLICAAAIRLGAPVLTQDQDFIRYAQHLRVRAPSAEELRRELDSGNGRSSR